jgi:hypothetical protein
MRETLLTRRDSFYASPFWRYASKRWRGIITESTAPGCSRKAAIVDHIVSRRRGGADALSNFALTLPGV